MQANMEIKMFEGGLRGVTVKTKVNKDEILFFAPLSSLMITTDFTKTLPIGSILSTPKNKKKHDSGKGLSDLVYLAIFILEEKAKGSDSDWF